MGRVLGVVIAGRPRSRSFEGVARCTGLGPTGLVCGMWTLPGSAFCRHHSEQQSNFFAGGLANEVEAEDVPVATVKLKVPIVGPLDQLSPEKFSGYWLYLSREYPRLTEGSTAGPPPPKEPRWL